MSSSFHFLPLEKNNVKIPDEYCYIVIVKYTENHFQPQKGKKKLTAEENKNKKELIQKQQDTLKQLDAGYCNLHNRKIELSSIFDSIFTRYPYDCDNNIIYKIKPLASYEISRNYDNKKRFEVSEFEIVEKFKDKNEVIEQIHKDKLLPELSAIMFNNLSSTNEGYNLKLFDYFKYINNKFNDLEISLSDIVLNLQDYKNEIRSKFTNNNTYEIVKENIRYLLDNKLIKYIKEEDYYQVRLVVALIDCGLYDVALNCIKLMDEYYIKQLLKEKKFESVLKKWSTDKTVKEIISLLNIKLSGLTLMVKEYGEYGENRIIETVNFDNIGDIKTYLIKKYDVPFEKIIDKDVSGLQFEYYEFSVI
jgi:hypothetical protein